MAEKSYFRSQLDSAIQETEKLLKALHGIAESRDLETALELSVTAAKISEGVAFHIFSSVCIFLSVYVFALLGRLTGDPTTKRAIS